MVRNKKNRYILAALFLLLLLAVTAGVLTGAASITLRDMVEMLQGGELNGRGRIMAYVRLPRVAGAVVAGMGLAASGAVIQIILNNPLAGPNIIGVNAGAGFAVVLCGALFPASYSILPFAAFLGAFLTVLLVYELGRRTGASKITLVLSGVAVNSFLNGLTDAVHTWKEESLLASSVFKIGGLSGINLNVLKMAGLVVAAAVILLLVFHNELEVFGLGEETAHTLGLPVGFYRFFFLFLAAMAAGAAVSFAGLLGFVGLLVPHIARRLVGEETRDYLLASVLLGALFLTVCDTAARTLFAPYEIPVGIILSLLGAPFFLWILFRSGVRRGAGKSM